uniref:Uncharacterized protein n=1 Tax=Lepeophtheirus salmonis TaxID=72036 RepID=A0A0K2VEZ4_LEPSM
MTGLLMIVVSTTSIVPIFRRHCCQEIFQDSDLNPLCLEYCKQNSGSSLGSPRLSVGRGTNQTP